MSIPRFLVIFLISDWLYAETSLKSSRLFTHLVDINPLLDHNELFMYEDPYYRALIRKVIINYPHLVNDNYDFSEILQEKSEIYDKYFSSRGNKTYDPS